MKRQFGSNNLSALWFCLLALFASLPLIIIPLTANASDCNNNSIEDSIDLADQTESDCNANSYPDSCDLDPFPQFISSYTFMPFDAPIPQFAVDFDSDPLPDVIALSSAGTKITLLGSSRDFGGGISTLLQTPALKGLVPLDTNLDSDTDMVGWSASTVYFIRATAGVLSIVQQFNGGSIAQVITADVNGDGLQDLVIGQSDVPQIKISLSIGSTFGSLTTINLASNQFEHGVLDLKSSDLNGNGIDDIVALLDVNYVEVYSPGNSVTVPPIAVNGVGRQIFVSDYDADDDMDFIVIGTQSIVTLRNDGVFNFTDVNEQSIGTPTGKALFADFDSDGVSDFVIPPRLGLFRGRDDGTFDVKPAFDQSSPDGVVGDFDLDTRPDVFFVSGGRYLNKPGSWSQDEDSDSVPDECQPGLLTSPVYVPWNSFLGMVNILELLNPSGVSENVKVEVLSLDGIKLSETLVGIAPGAQFDLIINDSANFILNSYGLIKITFPAGGLEGRMSQYRPRGATGEFEFQMTIPFVQSIRGKSALTFNTFDPQATGSSKETRRVDEFLSLVNLSPTNNLLITDRRFNLAGGIIATAPVFLRPLQRIDLEAGHINPGPNNVGGNVLSPDDPNAPYLAFSTRYGVTTDKKTGAFLRYRYANTVQAQTGLLPITKIPFARSGDSVSIAELINQAPVSDAQVVQIFGKAGNLINQFYAVIPAFGQVHLQAVDYIPAGENGSLQIFAPASSLLNVRSRGPVLQAVNYVTEIPSKELISAFTVPGRSYFGENLSGSYNRFLSITDTLRMSSTIGTSGQCSIDVLANGLVQSSSTLSFAPHETKEVVLDELLGAQANSYGVVQVTPLGTSKGVIADVIRRRPLAKSRVDFVASTPAR